MNLLRKYKISKIHPVVFTDNEIKALSHINYMFSDLRIIELSFNTYYFIGNKLIFNYFNSNNKIELRWEDIWEPLYRYTVGYNHYDGIAPVDPTIDLLRFFLKERLNLILYNDIYSFMRSDDDTLYIEKKYKI